MKKILFKHNRSTPEVLSRFNHGYGTMIEQEHMLQSSVSEIARASAMQYSANLKSILKSQLEQIGSAIFFLEQRCRSLPIPDRFRVLMQEHFILAEQSGEPGSSADTVKDLIARHINLVCSLETLIARSAQHHTAELILSEVVRRHEEMAWTLAGLLQEESSREDRHEWKEARSTSFQAFADGV